MVLSKSELVASLQHEIRILLHLVSKVDRAQLAFRPTPKQRSTLELLQYLAMMGPALVDVAMTGLFDGAVWTARETEAKRLDFDQTVAAIAAQHDTYAQVLGALADEDYRTGLRVWDIPTSRGAFIVAYVLCGHAAYRTQLFGYLKACGRQELRTSNLWDGVDPKAAAS
jgi:hypothetical protein